MKKIIWVLLVLFILCSSLALAVSSAGASAVLKNNPEPDNRADTLKSFLTKYNSPLVTYAWLFVKKADEYGLDWRLVPAISGVESSFGKRIPAGSFNAYGWNGGNYWFDSWEDSIDILSRSLKEKYVNRGLDTPEKISPVYCPPNSAWGSNVRYFMNKIENFDTRSVIDFSLLTFFPI